MPPRPVSARLGPQNIKKRLQNRRTEVRRFDLKPDVSRSPLILGIERKVCSVQRLDLSHQSPSHSNLLGMRRVGMRRLGMRLF